MAGGATDEAIAFLQKTSTVTGGTVYRDLARVIGRILLERPENAVDLLETTLLTKKNVFTPEDPAQLPEPKPSAATEAIRGLYVTPEPEVDPETGAVSEPQPPNIFDTEDLVEASELFASVGVGLGPIEMYHVALAAQRLGENQELQLESVRFFGKFFGLKGAYYVYETKLKDPPPPPEDAKPEEVNPKLNAHVYFVQSSPGGAATQLPLVTPLMMLRAKQMKRYLQGDLDAEVSAYPVFPGKEAHYLRALVGHIAAETTLVPMGSFTEGEGGVIEPTDGYTPMGADDLVTPDGWVKRYPQITDQGRSELDVNPEDEEGEEAPLPPQLTALEAADWASLKNSTVLGAKHQVTGVASMKWPGAYAVACNGRFACLYVGDGVRNVPLSPVAPPPLMTEYNMEDIPESSELPPKPEDPTAEGGDGEDAEGEADE